MPGGILLYLKIKDMPFHADRDQHDIGINTYIYNKYHALLW